jgi:preprotein translocase subunit YajC
MPMPVQLVIDFMGTMRQAWGVINFKGKQMKKLFMVLSQAPVLAFAADEMPLPPDGGFSQMLTLFAIAMLFFYFILWRPEQKRRKAADALRSQLKKGDRVTAIGIVGTVNKVNEQTVILNMVDGSKIEVLKAAITEVNSGPEEEVKKID